MRHLLILALTFLQPCFAQDADNGSTAITTAANLHPRLLFYSPNEPLALTNSPDGKENVSLTDLEKQGGAPQILRFGRSEHVESSGANDIPRKVSLTTETLRPWKPSLRQGGIKTNRIPPGRKKRFVGELPTEFEDDVQLRYGQNDSTYTAIMEDILNQKRAPKALLNSHIMHFGKKKSTGMSSSPQIMRFGKKFSQLSVPSILRFGKRNQMEAILPFLPLDEKSQLVKYCLIGAEKRDQGDEPEMRTTDGGDLSSEIAPKGLPSDDNAALHLKRCEEILAMMIGDNVTNEALLDDESIAPFKRNLAFSNPQMMRFGKRATNAFSSPEILHFGKRRGVDAFSNPQMMRFGKKSTMDNPQILHFGKKSDFSFSNPQMMRFGKKNDFSFNSPQMMRFGRKSDFSFSNPQMMRFGKKNDFSFSNPQMMRFGKKNLKQFNNPNMMRFGKKSSIKSPHMMHFGKKSLEQFSTPDIMRFGKRAAFSSPQMMHFGKKNLEQFSNPDIMRFGKRGDFSSSLSPVLEKRSMDQFAHPNIMRFGKRSGLSGPEMMHFGKRNLDQFTNPNIMRFGRKFENPQMMHFGKRDMEDYRNPSMESFVQSSSGTIANGEFPRRDSENSTPEMSYFDMPQRLFADSTAQGAPLEWKRTMGFSSSSPGSRHALVGPEMMHFGKKAIEAFKNPSIMRFGKRYSFSGPEMMHFGKRTLETSGKSLPGDERDSSSLDEIPLFGKRILNNFNNPNIMRFGRSVMFKDSDVLVNDSADTIDDLVLKMEDPDKEALPSKNLESGEARFLFSRSKRNVKSSGLASPLNPVTESPANETTTAKDKDNKNLTRKKREVDNLPEDDEATSDEEQGDDYPMGQQQKRWGLLKPRQLFPMYEPQEFLVPHALMVANLHRPSRSLPWRQRWARSRPMFLHFG